MHGATYDTGMLIALERRKKRALETHQRLRERQVIVSVPAVVVAEWWRGRRDDREHILRSIDVEPAIRSRVSAQLAGEALAVVQRRRDDDECRCKLLVDAVVMASASMRGDVVYSSDIDDLTLFSRVFPNVRVLAA